MGKQVRESAAQSSVFGRTTNTGSAAATAYWTKTDAAFTDSDTWPRFGRTTNTGSDTSADASTDSAAYAWATRFGRTTNTSSLVGESASGNAATNATATSYEKAKT